MLKEDFSDKNKDHSSLLQSIYNNIHKNGAVSLSELETLSLLKHFNNISFSKFEPHFLFTMGLFFKENEPESFLDLIYKLYSKNIEDTYKEKFTPVQADIFDSVKKNNNFSFSAPTSTGKSFLFREIIKSAKKDILIVAPSRALLAEYIIKIKKYTDKKTLVLPFIELVNNKKINKRIFVVTPERSNELFKHLNVIDLEFILFDEAQLSEDGIRGMRFDAFVRRLEKRIPKVPKIFAHPFVHNPEAQFEKHNINEGTKSTSYKENNVGKIFINYDKTKFSYFSPYNTRSKPLAINCPNDPVEEILLKGGTCLIYISKAKIYNNKFQEEYKSYIDLCQPIENPEALKLIEELEIYLGVTKDRKSLTINMLKLGIVLHHGSMPLKARSILEKFVNENFARICFATSTLIQGINMPFNLVWIDNSRFNGNENSKILNLKNLIGRAGRSTLGKIFDYGIVVIKTTFVKDFKTRINKDAYISKISLLDEESINNNSDFIDDIESIKEDTFSNEYNLPQSQVDRLGSDSLNKDIKLILDELFFNGNIIPAEEYYKIEENKRDKIKEAFKKIFISHLRRSDLKTGEKSVLSASIPILLWLIQGKSFAEVVTLRYNYLSCKKERMQLLKKMKNEEINDQQCLELMHQIKIRFSNQANQIPNIKLTYSSPLFKKGTSARDIDFDKVIYDTYDYIDKVISFSLKDPLCTAFNLYYSRLNDKRALVLSNYIAYGTNNEAEIWLLKYGFSFEDIKWILPYIDNINSDEIIFNSKIGELNESQREIIERYI